MTSVKEVRVEAEPTGDELGRGRFAFTDDYSVFDWGKMPDRIPGKGASLCTMAAFNFELLEANHVPTHYRGVVEESDADGGGEVKELGECERPPREMAVDLARVPNLRYEEEYDYEAFYDEVGSHYLIPLEIVFRNVVPVGSSLRERGDPRDYGLDRASWPDEPIDLPEPVVEFSTKFEERDRYLDREEADRIAGPAGIDRLEELALAVNHLVTERAAAAGFDHEDGKIECLYDGGAIEVADAVGTFDENRFSRRGQQVSKEVVRQYYKRADPDWVAAVADAKSEADERGVADWRTLCDRDPEPLPDGVVRAAAALYRAGANAYAGADWFDAPAVDDAVAAVREL